MQVLTRKNYRFDNFQLDLLKRRLLRSGKTVSLNPKAFDLLSVLIEHNGELLTKDDLFRLVWEEQNVEESNLTVNMSAIRKALGERASSPRYITTVSGRGYYFTANLKDAADENLVIESRTISRIVVEQEEIEEEKGRRGEGEKTVMLPKVSPSPLLPVSVSKIYKIAVLISALTILIGAGYFLLFRQNAKSALPFQKMSISLLTTSGRATKAALSPDGKLYVFARRETDKRESLWLGHIDGGEQIELRPPLDKTYASVAFSPDGNRIYFELYDSESAPVYTLYRLPVLGGVQEKIKESVTNRVTFAPDGKQFAFIRPDPANNQSFLVISEIDGADEHEIVSRPSKLDFVPSSMAWSPDGKLIAVSALADEKNQASTEIFIVTIADRSIGQLTNLEWNSVSALKWTKDSAG